MIALFSLLIANSLLAQKKIETYQDMTGIIKA